MSTSLCTVRGVDVNRGKRWGRCGLMINQGRGKPGPYPIRLREEICGGRVV